MRAAFLAFLLLALTAVHAQVPQKGDDLADHFSRFPSAYTFDAPAFSSWAEGKGVILMGIAPDLDNNEFLFMATAERIPFWRVRARGFRLFPPRHRRRPQD